MTAKLILRHLLDRRAGFDADKMSGRPEATVFLSPDNRTPGHIDPHTGIWSPPHRSTASRLPSAKSGGSCRGSVVDRRTNRVLVFESHMESELAEILMARNDVVDIRDQPPPVAYTDDDGKIRHHTFDFMAVTGSGIRTAYAVKPKHRVGKSGLGRTVDLIRKQASEHFADSYRITTERDLQTTKVFNARLILRSRKCCNEGLVRTMRELVSTLRGAVRLGDLVLASGLGADGFNALVCLIGDGELETVSDVRIDHRADIRRRAA